MAVHYLFQNEDSNGHYFDEPLGGTALHFISFHFIELFKFQFQFAIFVMSEKIKWVAVAIAVSQKSSFTLITSSHQLTIIDQDKIEFLILSI